MEASNHPAPATARPGAHLLDRLKRMLADEAVPKSRWSESLQLAHVSPLCDRPLVLVVDDNPANLMEASEMLSSLGIKALLAADGAEAVILACELRLDLILMDLQMPVLDGLGATVQIRRFERANARRRVPVVAYTSSPVNADQPFLRRCGIDAALEKPADAQAIRACVMRWCLPTGAEASPALALGLEQLAGQAPAIRDRSP